MGQTVTAGANGLSPADAAALGRAMRALRSPGNPVVRSADLLGRLLGRAGDRLLQRAGLSANHPNLTELAAVALGRAYDLVLAGERVVPARAPSLPLVALSGFAGGFAGLAGFLPDAVLTTVLIMREVASIAREEGEDLSSEAARSACIQVFGLRAEDETGYFSSRLMLQGPAAQAVLGRVAGRWAPMLGEKFAAGAVPLAGAVAASVLNTAFLAHYRQLARAHFTVRRLERAYGMECVRAVAGEPPNPAADMPFLDA